MIHKTNKKISWSNVMGIWKNICRGRWTISTFQQEIFLCCWLSKFTMAYFSFNYVLLILLLTYWSLQDFRVEAIIIVFRRPRRCSCEDTRKWCSWSVLGAPGLRAPTWFATSYHPKLPLYTAPKGTFLGTTLATSKRPLTHPTSIRQWAVRQPEWGLRAGCHWSWMGWTSSQST